MSDYPRSAPIGRGVFVPLPRREKIGRSPRPTSQAPIERAPGKDKTFAFYVMGRLWAYVMAMTLFSILNLCDALRMRGSVAKRGARLRQIVQGLGPIAIKVGQQLAARSDVLPQEYCDELNRLLEDAEPIPWETAVGILEAQLKRPTSEVFKVFDPEPIGSGSIGSVFQAYLTSGEKVAVKIRRSNIERVFLADMQVLRFFIALFERLSLMPEGRIANVIDECERMLRDEMDFILEARQGDLFRRETRDNDYVTAPKVFLNLCTKKMMVAEFVDGISMNEILNAVQSGDRELINELESKGYDFRKISQRLLQVFYWQTFESLIFHADLHPANILVKPDNTFVWLDFGCCGTLSDRYRKILLRLMRSIAEGHISEAAHAMMVLNEPLPPIQIDQYRFEMETVMRQFIISGRSRNVSWQEKCFGGAMSEIMQISKKYQVIMSPELLRYSRANTHLDLMVYRLYEKTQPGREFRRWFRTRARRIRQRAARNVTTGLRELPNVVAIQMSEFRGVSSDLSVKFQDYLDSKSLRFVQQINKIPLVISEGVRFVINALLIVAALTLGRIVISQAIYKHAPSEIEQILAVIRHPMVHAVFLILLLITLRRILVGTRTVDVRGPR